MKYQLTLCIKIRGLKFLLCPQQFGKDLWLDISDGNIPQRTKRGEMFVGNTFLSKKIRFFLTVRFAQKLMLKTRKNDTISALILNYLKTMLARKLRISPFGFTQNPIRWTRC
jgi:hypothetical protein